MKFSRLLIAAAALACVAGAKKPTIDLRVHAEGTEAEAPTFAIPATLLNGRPAFLQRMPLATQSEIEAIYPFAAADGSQGVYLKLDQHGSRLLQQHSMSQQGKMLAVMLNGRMVSNLLVDRPIADGIVAVPRGLTPEDIAVLTSAFPVLGQEGTKKKR
jgi:preprotein translocase subunit SecD